MKAHTLMGLVVVLLLGADTPKDPRESADEKKFQGTWNVVSTVFDGQPAPKEKLKGRKVVIDRQQLTAFVGDTRGRTLIITLDPKQRPQQIDLKRADRDEVAQGIYALEGDELKLCYGEPGAKRPTEFASKAGSKVFLLLLRRGGR
jgi:uncharacterized protein (TIGR03067 family)